MGVSLLRGGAVIEWSDWWRWLGLGDVRSQWPGRCGVGVGLSWRVVHHPFHHCLLAPRRCGGLRTGVCQTPPHRTMKFWPRSLGGLAEHLLIRAH